jgi:hypothetical protein
MSVRALLILIVMLLLTGVHGADPVLVGRGVDLLDVLLSGGELHVRKSRGLADPLVLRITGTYQHGTAGFRYDFHCVPMIAGKHDLTQFLETAEGQPAKGLPPLIVEATGVLPAGPPGILEERPVAKPPRAGGYERLIPYGIALWVIGGAGAIWYYRRQKITRQLAASRPPLTLAQKLRPLLERAITEPLGTPEKAELERLMLAHGRSQLGLEHAADPAVWQALRNNPETASWLQTLESWLHRPASSPPTTEELRELLSRVN